MWVNFDLCLSQAIEHIELLQEKHPGVAIAITIPSLLDFLEEDRRILEPHRGKMYTDKKYSRLYNKLLNVKPNLFYKWLIK